MFWSLVRPDRILLPITRSAAVTASLEADELAVGMITCEIGADSWSSTLIKRRRRPFFGPLHKLTTPRGSPWGGGKQKPLKHPGTGARLRPTLVANNLAWKYYRCN